MSEETTSASTEANSESTENQTENTQEGQETEAVATDAKAAAPITPAQEKKIEKQLKEFKLKVDGKEISEMLDLSDNDAITKHLQMSKAAQARMQETAEIRKAAMQFIEDLRKNPRKILSDPNLGLDIKKLAQEIINDEVQEMAKSPEQREKEKLQKELEDLRAQQKKTKEDQDNVELERMRIEQEHKYETDFTKVLETSGLPKSPYTIKNMAQIMMTALQNNIDLSPEDVVPILKKQMHSDLNDFFSASPDDLLEELLKEPMKRIRKKSIAKSKTESVNNIKPTANNQKAEKTDKSDKKQSFRDFFGV